jgi:hypothetical protein
MDSKIKSPASTLGAAAATARQLDKHEPTALAVVEKPGAVTHPDLNALLAVLEHERIATLAYFYWQQRGCPEGSPEDDWFRAEHDIREKS